MIKNPEDIVGAKFGKLTVERYAGRVLRGKSSANMYECRCDCGSTGVIADRDFLMSGNKKSCGCAYKDASGSRLEDLTGQRFGRWCQGSQHEKSVKWFGGDAYFERLQIHDRMKREFAAAHGIRLVEIPYTAVQYSMICSFLNENSVV